MIKPSSTNAYDTKFTPEKGATLHFVDFDLTYLGLEDHSPDPLDPTYLLPISSTFTVFEATDSTEKVKITWSSGTGEIGPASFTISGKDFYLYPYDPKAKDQEMDGWYIYRAK
jgi:hypothetical protein